MNARPLDNRWVQRLGETADSEYVLVFVELETRELVGAQTVTHDLFSGPFTRLSIHGETRHKNANRRADCRTAGQIIDALDDVTAPAPGWSLEEIRELRDIWRAWHLNDMRAACAHMDVAQLVREDNGYGGTRISTSAPENVCQESDYQYGHAWLVEPLPSSVLERLAYLMRDRSDDLYRARGYDGAGRAFPTDDNGQEG